MKRTYSESFWLLIAVVLNVWRSSMVMGADPVFTLGNATVMGSGCPVNSAQAVTAPDGQSISLLFSGYAAQTSSDVTRDRKACNFALPITAVPGISVGFFQFDYRGSAYVPSVTNAKASFTSSYFFAGQTEGVQTCQSTYNPGFDDDILESNPVGIGAVVWTPCGATSILRINSAIVAQKPTRGCEDVQIAIDTLDTSITSAMQLYITYKQC